jgi:hypothetical protein
MKIILSISLALFLATLSFSQELNDGSIVKSNSSEELYLVFNRELHYIPNMNSFNSLFIANPKIDVYSAVDLEILPRGDTLKDVRLIKSNGPAIYLQYNGVKRHVTTPEAFNILQFDWNKVIIINDEDLFRHTTLKPIIIDSVKPKEKETWEYY